MSCYCNVCCFNFVISCSCYIITFCGQVDGCISFCCVCNNLSNSSLDVILKILLLPKSDACTDLEEGLTIFFSKATWSIASLENDASGLSLLHILEVESILEAV